MAKYNGPVCRLCRREGEKLFLKGDRCFTSKCSVERREGAAPGMHGKARQSFSDFKVRLREKQKVKRIFGLLEGKFRKYYDKAASTKGVTGSQMLLNLETRLDNIVYRLGFAASRSQARQLVVHGVVRVNGVKVNKPSYSVAVNDVVEISEKHKKNTHVVASMEAASQRVIPEWLSLERADVRGSVKALPTREQMVQGVNEQLIVELYSK
jgi:small subunit ribosomal protein S4